MPQLSNRDVASLLNDRSAANRARVGGKIASQFRADELGDKEREIAEGIFRVLVRDIEVVVRKALSETLKDCPSVPRDVALSLAHDVIDVAGPMLRYSEVLDDGDLIEIIHTRGSEYRIAVAERNGLGETVSDALVETRDGAVVKTLVANHGARISGKTLDKVVSDFGTREDIQEGLVHRPVLPARTIERLVSLVSENLRVHLVANHDMPAELAESLVLETRENTVVRLLGPHAKRRDVEGLVRQMQRNDRLTPGLLIRALEVGDLEFFEHGIAARARIPVENARRLLRDPGSNSHVALYRQARLPEEHFGIVRYRIDIAYGHQADPPPLPESDTRDTGPSTFTPRLVDETFVEFYRRGWTDRRREDD